jgi:hypothetical protein
MTTPAIPETAPRASGLRRWSAYLGPAVSVAILCAVLWQLRQLNWLMVVSIIPRSPLIWLVLAASYFAGPVADWVIFRKLWGIPLSGLAPLLKKLVGNELLLGYVGEVYFYDWARRHVKMEGSPFGAVKDVAILSALAGNIITILMMVCQRPDQFRPEYLADRLGHCLCPGHLAGDHLFAQGHFQPFRARLVVRVPCPLHPYRGRHGLYRIVMAPDPARGFDRDLDPLLHHPPSGGTPSLHPQQGHRVCRHHAADRGQGSSD